MNTAQFIANILIQCMHDVGPQNVVQVIMDNAKNYRVVGMLIEMQFEHLVLSTLSTSCYKSWVGK